MNSVAGGIPRMPTLPKPFALPLGWIPTAANSLVLANVLNRLFAPELADGELDFLQQRVMLIEVRDARLRYRLTLEGGGGYARRRSTCPTT